MVHLPEASVQHSCLKNFKFLGLKKLTDTYLTPPPPEVYSGLYMLNNKKLMHFVIPVHVTIYYFLTAYSEWKSFM
jgi:hypothetical protein